MGHWTLPLNDTIMAKQKKVTKYRDAETGAYVTKEYAEENPATTVKETDLLSHNPRVWHNPSVDPAILEKARKAVKSLKQPELPKSVTIKPEIDQYESETYYQAQTRCQKKGCCQKNCEGQG